MYVQDFRGLSALLICNKAEHPRKHLELTSAFHWGTDYTLVNGPGKFPALRTEKQSVMIKHLKSHRP